MCFIIKVSQKLLDENKFACSKIILWIHFSWMYNGKPTFSKKSCLQQITQPTPPHTTIRSKMDVPWLMCSDLFYEENPTGSIIARGHLQ